ncbi:hypothetical protein K1719_012790 [Acacia pycnantha]|nr:hypothetical protein K1719_012790 [Acacia pycnantha]
MYQSNLAIGDEIIEALFANSATFEKKTSFSQEKYRRRKQKKYAPKVLLRRPVARSKGFCGWIHYLFYSLWLMSLATQTFLSLICLTGTGFVCNSYLGPAPYSMDIARIFNFSDEICKRYLT